MNQVDWIVLVSVLLIIVFYGLWKSRGTGTIDSYLLADRSLPWYVVGFSVFATQASAITFLSMPGQAYTDGMRFIQFYFGLPLATIIIAFFFIPLYQKLKVYTAYEYLETRFDLKTRVFAAFLFLLQRGLLAGLTIYAPSIIVSTLLGWNIYLTNLVVGGLVIAYTVTGGSKALSYTQFIQFFIILSGIFLAGYMILNFLPSDVSFIDIVKVAGKTGKLKSIDFSFDVTSRYNIWSGTIGGLFLMLAYFGTDQTQVMRYLSGKSIKQSQMGLIMNGLIKIPMQFCILFVGIILSAFFWFEKPPLIFNPTETKKIL